MGAIIQSAATRRRRKSQGWHGGILTTMAVMHLQDLSKLQQSNCRISNRSSIALNRSINILGRILSSVFVLIILVPCYVNCENEEDNNGPASRMRPISEDLDRHLNDMASQGINYSIINTTGLPYNATTKFKAKGMSQLYNITNTFIDLVQDKQAFPEGTKLHAVLSYLLILFFLN